MKRQKSYADELESSANVENEMETLVYRLGEKVILANFSIISFFQVKMNFYLILIRAIRRLKAA